MPPKRGPKTLIIVLKSLMDMEFVIEMKNDTEILGVLDQVDDGMKSVMRLFPFRAWLSSSFASVQLHYAQCDANNKQGMQCQCLVATQA